MLNVSVSLLSEKHMLERDSYSLAIALSYKTAVTSKNITNVLWRTESVQRIINLSYI